MVGRVSRIDAIQQQQMASANKKQAEIESRQIIKALISLENGDYGYCESCENDIPYERLMAKPTSITCISCQSKKEESL